MVSRHNKHFVFIIIYIHRIIILIDSLHVCVCVCVRVCPRVNCTYIIINEVEVCSIRPYIVKFSIDYFCLNIRIIYL